MGIAAGPLNKKVTIQRRDSEAKDSWGQPTGEWKDVAVSVWASIRTLSGSGFINQEFVAGGAEISRATASIRIRKRSGITHDMRVLHKDVVYDIKQVLPDPDGIYIDLACATGANKG